MILILLTRFCESVDSPGFQLCRLLAEQGQHLYVTTTSSGDALHEEIKNASDINISSKGSITIFSPEHVKDQIPSTEWITKYHNKYFSYLSRIDDIETLIGIYPGTEQTAVELKESLKCSMILAVSAKIGENDRNLQHLNEMLRESNELWSVGSEIFNHNRNKLQLPDTTFNGKHKEIMVSSKKGNPIGNILVLMSTFSECEESLPAFLLTLKLAKIGHHVYVTTTSTDHQLDEETKKARQLTEVYDGHIELLEPQAVPLETSSLEWIQNQHGQRVLFLSKLKVQNVVGTLPGTAQTAIQLREMLNCKTILLATCKIEATDQNMREYVIKSARAADEVWSVGPDIYAYYKHMFEEESQIRHEEISLLPDINIASNSEHYTGDRKLKTPKFVSVWKTPTEFIQNDSKEYSKGSDIEGYYNISKALGQINAEEEVSWVIHGLQIDDPKVHVIREHSKPNVLKVSASSSIPNSEGLNWDDCCVFLVPDREEDTLNFSALTAIWLGIPTLLSSQSSIGKFLLSLDCPEKSRAVVNLIGDPSHDAEEWRQKINKEILEVNPMEWATTLSDHLRIERTYLESFLSDMTEKGELTARPLSENPVGFSGYFHFGKEESLLQEATIDCQSNLNGSDSMQSYEGDSTSHDSDHGKMTIP